MGIFSSLSRNFRDAVADEELRKSLLQARIEAARLRIAVRDLEQERDRLRKERDDLKEVLGGPTWLHQA